MKLPLMVTDERLGIPRWKVLEGEGTAKDRHGNEVTLRFTCVEESFDPDFFRRFVAAFNACSGVDLEVLESGQLLNFLKREGMST